MGVAMFSGLEFRLDTPAEGSPVIHGRAVPWDSLSVPLWQDHRTGKPVRERFARGAFAEVLKQPGLDVVALRDHDDSRLLGRTLSGTLRVYESDGGLDYDFDCPNTTDGNDVRELVARGDLRGSSFAFGVTPADEERQEADDCVVRVIHRVRLLRDVSPTTSPAYPASQVFMRAAAAVQNEMDSWRACEPVSAAQDAWYRERLAQLAVVGL